MKKLILIFHIFFLYLFAQEPLVLQGKYIVNNDSVYSDDLFNNIKASFEVTKIPQNTFTHRVPASTIINKFKEYNIDIQKPQDYYITFERNMNYDEKYITNYIAQAYQNRIKGLSITDIQIEANSKSDLMGFNIENISIDNYALDNNTGTATVKFTKGTNYRNIYFKYKVIGNIKVAVATTNINTDESINTSNVSFNDTVFEKNIQSISELDLGSDICASTIIPQNSVIKLTSIKKIPVIKKGSVVTAYYHAGALQIEFEAIAMQDGAKNDFISVKRVDNNNLYKAMVVNGSSVRIH